MGAATRDTLPACIEVLADLRRRDGAGLPVAELAGFGFELLIGRALDRGWQEVFAASGPYADYAAERRAAGLG